MPPELALRLTLISSHYPCLKHIFMVSKVLKPMKFYCILKCGNEMADRQYRKNSNNWDTLNYYRDCPTNGIAGFYSAILRSKDADRITNRVDTDQTAP